MRAPAWEATRGFLPYCHFFMVRHYAAADFIEFCISLSYYISILLITYASDWRAIMSDFVTRLRLAEQAAEDIYFAKLSRELIACLHKRVQAEKNSISLSVQSGAEVQADDRPETVARLRFID